MNEYDVLCTNREDDDGERERTRIGVCSLRYRSNNEQRTTNIDVCIEKMGNYKSEIFINNSFVFDSVRSMFFLLYFIFKWILRRCRIYSANMSDSRHDYDVWVFVLNLYLLLIASQ